MPCQDSGRNTSNCLPEGNTLSWKYGCYPLKCPKYFLLPDGYLSSLNTDKVLSELVDPVYRPIIWNDKRVRALRPWSEEDQNLLQAISRGEFKVNGFRNRDIFRLLSPSILSTVEEKHRAAARITRKFRILRAHGIIRKVNHTHRYVVTRKGQNIISAVLMFQQVSLKQLNRAVA